MIQKDTPYTVREVAMRLSTSKRDDDLNFLMRQLKHWTNSNLLRTVGAKNVGTGRSRSYSKMELIAAAYLLELSKYGVTVGQLAKFRACYDRWMKDPQSMNTLLGGKDQLQRGGFLIYYGTGDKPNKLAGFALNNGGGASAQELFTVCASDKDCTFCSALAVNCASTVDRLELE